MVEIEPLCLYYRDTHCNKVIPCLEDLQSCLIHQVGHLTASCMINESIHQTLTEELQHLTVYFTFKDNSTTTFNNKACSPV